MEKRCKLVLYFLFLSFYMIGQQTGVIPGHSLSILPLIIDSTKIEPFLNSVPEKYLNDDYYSWDEFSLIDSTIVLSVHRYDQNRIIRKIQYAPEIVDTLSNGLIIRETKLSEYPLAKQRTYFYKSNGFIYLEEKGITYYFKVNKEEELNSVLWKIVIKSNERSVNLTPNYQFNYSLILEEIDEVTDLVDQFYIDEGLVLDRNKKPEFLSERIHVYDYIQREITPYLCQFFVQVRILQPRFIINIIYNKESNEIEYSYIGNRDTILHEYFKDSIDYYFGESSPRIISLEDYRETNIKETVGFWCSSGGSPPKRCYMMIEAINNRDDAILYDWLLSINPEISAYGYIGMKFLEMDKHRSNLSYQDLMREREKNKAPIFSCAGCAFSNNWIFFDYIMMNDLRIHWKGYKETRFLR